MTAGRLSTALMVLAAVLIVAAGPTLYASTAIDDEDAFVALSDDIVAHPEIRRAVAQAVVTVTIEVIATEETITRPEITIIIEAPASPRR